MGVLIKYELQILTFIFLVLLYPLVLRDLAVEISFAFLQFFKSVVQSILVCIFDGCQKVLLRDSGVNKQTTCLFLEANDDFFHWHLVPHLLPPYNRKASRWLKLILTLVVRHIALLRRSINTTVLVSS